MGTLVVDKGPEEPGGHGNRGCGTQKEERRAGVGLPESGGSGRRTLRKTLCIP